MHKIIAMVLLAPSSTCQLHAKTVDKLRGTHSGPTLHVWSWCGPAGPCAFCIWHHATYNHCKTRLCEIAKDMGILDLQLRSNQRMRGSNQRKGEQGCHVELRENSTTLQRKITLGTNGRLVRLSFFLLLGSPFYYILF